jgi:hypothetical protein
MEVLGADHPNTRRARLAQPHCARIGHPRTRTRELVFPQCQLRHGRCASCVGRSGGVGQAVPRQPVGGGRDQGVGSVRIEDRPYGGAAEAHHPWKWVPAVIPSDELRHLDIGPRPAERSAEAGTVSCVARCHSDSDQVGDRAREVLRVVLAQVDRPWPDLRMATAAAAMVRRGQRSGAVA